MAVPGMVLSYIPAHSTPLPFFWGEKGLRELQFHSSRVHTQKPS